MSGFNLEGLPALIEILRLNWQGLSDYNIECFVEIHGYLEIVLAGGCQATTLNVSLRFMDVIRLNWQGVVRLFNVSVHMYYSS